MVDFDIPFLQLIEMSFTYPNFKFLTKNLKFKNVGRELYAINVGPMNELNKLNVLYNQFYIIFFYRSR